MAQDAKSWTGTLSISNIQTIGSGDKHLSIEAKDLTDQKLDGNPQSIAKYNPNTNQKENYEDENSSGNSGGTDILHLWGALFQKYRLYPQIYVSNYILAKTGLFIISPTNPK